MKDDTAVLYSDLIIVICAALLSIGLVLVYSASAPYALEDCGFSQGCSSTTYLFRQVIYIMGFFLAMVLTAAVPLRVWYKFSKLGILVLILLLAGLLIPGVGRCYNNACRWYVLPGGFHIQPAEYAKVIWVVYLANALTRNRSKLTSFRRGILFYTIFMSIISGLIIGEPDFGNAVLLGCLTMVMLAVAGVPWKHFAIYGVMAILVGYFFIYQVDYRWERIIATYNPWENPRDQGYQIIQSWIALGSGGLFGQGLGSGLQKLRYLPEPFTDFILAVAGHELGFVGLAGIIALYGALFFFTYSVLRKIYLTGQATLDKGSYSVTNNLLLGTGLFSLLMFQAIANGSVILGLLPTKGLPMPFLSYGGSHLVATGIVMGLWLRIIREELKHT